MEIKRITDIDLLVQARVDYMSHDSHLFVEVQDSIISHLKSYFKEHVDKEDFVALAITENEEIVSIGFMLIRSMPPNNTVPSGKTGTLLNVLTYPQHRRKGYGKALIAAIVEEARRRKLDFIDLYATTEGKGLYEKLGFTSVPYEAMLLKL